MPLGLELSPPRAAWYHGDRDLANFRHGTRLVPAPPLLASWRVRDEGGPWGDLRAGVGRKGGGKDEGLNDWRSGDGRAGLHHLDGRWGCVRGWACRCP